MVQATEYLYVVRDDEILHREPIMRGTRTPVSDFTTVGHGQSTYAL